jgi:hypothetical protein
MSFKAPAGSNKSEWESQFNWVALPEFDSDLAKSQEIQISSQKKQKKSELAEDMKNLIKKTINTEPSVESLLKSSHESGQLQSLD